jgi:hypothetical protein
MRYHPYHVFLLLRLDSDFLYYMKLADLPNWVPF